MCPSSSVLLLGLAEFPRRLNNQQPILVEMVGRLPDRQYRTCLATTLVRLIVFKGDYQLTPFAL